MAHARSLALFGDLYGVEWMLHLVLAPLYQLTSFLVFTAVGPGFTASRAISAVFGCGLLLIFWAALRRRLPGDALVAGLAWLALQVDVVAHSRLAIPEIRRCSSSWRHSSCWSPDRPAGSV